MNCKVEGCNRPARTCGLCQKHYMDKYHYGLHSDGEDERIERRFAMYEARLCYQQAIGLPTRLRWLRAIKEIEYAEKNPTTVSA